MKSVIDMSPYFQDFVSKKVWDKTAALAMIAPELLSDIFPHLTVLHLERNNLLCMEDLDGNKWKVWCSRDGVFDISPSLTKGFGRDKEGIDIVEAAQSKFDGFIFITFKSIDAVEIHIKGWNSLQVSEKGKVYFNE